MDHGRLDVPSLWLLNFRRKLTWRKLTWKKVSWVGDGSGTAAAQDTMGAASDFCSTFAASLLQNLGSMLETFYTIKL
jgi:hypothetical protein